MKKPKSNYYLPLTLILSLLISFSVNAQSDETLDLKLKDKSLKAFFETVENKTNYTFMYNNIDLSQKVSIDVVHTSLDKILQEVLTPLSLSFEKRNNQILIISKNHKQYPSIPQPKRVITGTITDSEGEPIIGANVVEKGTTNGVITDIDGNFSITASDQSILQISYIGYLHQDIAVGKQTSIPIHLKEDTQSLDEVVVVGYGTQKKLNLTGAISNVKAEMLNNRTNANPINLLSGNVAGVTLIQNSGQPGADGAALRVRGVGTIGNSDAMVIVDGMESSFNNVDPNDIESISVLKDAAASSIYGVRAANGVVLITTKRGSLGAPIISYNAYAGWQNADRLPKYLGSYDYCVLLNEAYRNDGIPVLYSEDELQKFKSGADPDLYPNSDWLGTLFSEKGFFNNHHLSVDGGSEAIRYSVSMGLHEKKGLIPNTAYNKFNLRSNIDATINDRLAVILNLSAHRDHITSPSTSVANILHFAFRETPVTPIQFKNGNYALFKNEHNSVASARESGLSNTYNNNFQGNIGLTYKVFDGLTLRGSASTTFNLMENQNFARSVKYYTVNAKDPIRTTRSAIYNSNRRLLELNLQTYLDYAKSFGDHEVKGLLGYSQIYNQYRILSASRKDLPLNNTLSEINAGDMSTQETGGNMIEYALRSVFGRVNYSYKSRYLLEANIRRDGTSRFDRDHRFGYFPSFSLGWRVSEEPFCQISGVDNLKLRLSWGQLGNQEIGDYAFYNTYMFGQNYNFGNMLAPGISVDERMANELISWEKTTQFNVGVDLDVKNGLFSFVGDFFIKNTNDILLELPIPAIVGLLPPMQNAGRVRNTGVELQLNHRNTVRDFKYFSTLNFSYVYNEITDLSGGDIPGRSVGDPINNIFGYVCEGIFQSQNEIDGHAKQIWGSKPGDLKYKDINGDQVVDEKDRISIGSYFPKINTGLRLGVEYKNFDFSTLFQGAFLVKAIVKPEINIAFNNGGKAVQSHLDRWTPENQDATYPRLTMKESQKNSLPSTFWAKNASYVKMRNVQIGYAVPKQQLSKLGLEKMRFYFSVDNLLTFTSFEGVDPEAAYNMNDLSVESSYYPISRSYSFGLNVSF